MTKPIDNFLDWLRDAHAMEQQSEKMLQGVIDRLEHYPKLRAQLQLHLEETHGQQQLLKGCLDRLGASPSLVKDISGKVIAFGQTVSGMFVEDEVVKAGMSTYIFEQMEIASYTILAAAAKANGDVETQRVCELILAQEIAMADWLKENLPELTFAYLSRSADEPSRASR
jgi:ferritin-like metal-binding protein YciE